jgi:hypothetical protein
VWLRPLRQARVGEHSGVAWKLVEAPGGKPIQRRLRAPPKDSCETDVVRTTSTMLGARGAAPPASGLRLLQRAPDHAGERPRLAPLPVPLIRAPLDIAQPSIDNPWRLPSRLRAPVVMAT